MTFTASTYENFIAEPSPVHARVTPAFTGAATAFDIVIVGSGMGGGVLANALAERHGGSKRILLLEAGSYLYPTHVYNCSRMDNAAVAQRFGCSTFRQAPDPDSRSYIGERPQLGFGGRSIFWSGLIPTVQPWELAFFPPRVRADLEGGLLAEAGATMNASVTLGRMAETIVERLRASPLEEDFVIEQTPRALHQSYLLPNGAPAPELLLEPTGVFNTAELLINQLGASSSDNSGASEYGLNLLLNRFVEDVRRLDDGRLEVLARDTLTGTAHAFQAGVVVLAAGSIESPKLLARSSLGRDLPPSVASLIGRGLTDHPTTDSTSTEATHIGDMPLSRNALAKIIFYSRGARGRVRYPFNVEMNVNHEYWHLRENDPSLPEQEIGQGDASVVDIKFSFGNCLEPANEIRRPPPFGYVPDILFRDQRDAAYLARERFPALAGWDPDDPYVFDVLNAVTGRIFAQFSNAGASCEPRDGTYAPQGKGFGNGTVHHAAGSLRMPSKERHDGGFMRDSVVDEDLRVVGTRDLYVCDMSVMPFATAANPVRTLTALALRLSRTLEHFR